MEQDYDRTISALHIVETHTIYSDELARGRVTPLGRARREVDGNRENSGTRNAGIQALYFT